MKDKDFGEWFDDAMQTSTELRDAVKDMNFKGVSEFCLAAGIEQGKHEERQRLLKPVPGLIIQKPQDECHVVDRRPYPHGKMSPNDLEILIHFYVSPTQHPRAEYIDAACDAMKGKGLLDIDGHFKWFITSKGKAFLQCILATPFPKQVWLDGNGKLIDIDGNKN
ncbi:MAG: hypothetical protein KAV87_00085 [Desulfobacteraceae bacterium]|nr:hypothetical protein [Desulfobacteraceae bacterium]